MRKTVASKSLNWREILTALRTCTGEPVLIRDGKETAPAGVVRSRPSAKGSELCLFSAESPATRLDLIQQLETLADGPGRRFMKSARASINDSYLLVESVADENLDDVIFAVINTRRPVLGFNQGAQTGDSSHLRTKRVKRG